MSEAILEQITENLIKGQAPVVKELVQKAIDAGVSAEDILNKGLVAGMSVIGDRFKRNEVYIPEVLIAARAMRRRGRSAVQRSRATCTTSARISSA
jgi:methanogenic corrinoid protein MtbC1